MEREHDSEVSLVRNVLGLEVRCKMTYAQGENGNRREGNRVNVYSKTLRHLPGEQCQTKASGNVE